MAAEDSSTTVELISGVLAFGAGFASAVFAEPIRQRIFRPKIALHFSGGDDCVTRTPTFSAGMATYLRVRATVSGGRTARACRAFMVGIETKSQTGSYTQSNFVDSLPLAWSCSPAGTERSPRDLLKGVSQYIDVVTAYDNSPNLEPQFAPIPMRYNDLFRPTEHTFRFTILVSGDGAQPSKIRLVVAWKGDAKSMDVYEDPIT